MRQLFAFLVFSGLSLTIAAQNLYNDGALIVISRNTTLYANQFTNNGRVINNGNIVVGSIWQNNADYDPGIGSLTLSGSQPQVLNHNAKSFNRLIIRGGGVKIFEADLVIEDEILLENGLLLSANGSIIRINDGATINGGNANSYVVGRMLHNGTGDKFFPIGTDLEYLPVNLYNIQGQNVSTSLEATAPNLNLQTAGVLDQVSDRWSWLLQQQGVFESAEVELPLNNETWINDINSVVVAEAPDLENGFTSLGQASVSGDLTSGFVRSALPATKSYFTIGIDLELAAAELPPIQIFNAVTPNNDGIHDFLKIENITFYPENKVVIYTKIGEKVFEIDGYNNVDLIFTGRSNLGQNEDLPDGTYYYFIDTKNRKKVETGFFVLKR